MASCRWATCGRDAEVATPAGPVDAPPALRLQAPVRLACFDWGGTLMAETGGPADQPMARWPTLQVLPGAREALQALHGRVPVALCTNATVSRRADIEAALRRVDLWRHIGPVFCFTELGLRKDRRGFWQAVAHSHGLGLAELAMVGDSLAQDAVAPRRFGVQGVWLRTPGGGIGAPPAGVPVVDDLRRFADAVLAATA